MKSNKKNACSVIASVALISLVCWALLATVELSYWNHRVASYPELLLRQPPADAHDLRSLRAACRDPLDVVAWGHEKALVRCGLIWPAADVWKVDRRLVAPALP